MAWTFEAVGAKYAGPCVVCGRQTLDRELAATILYVRREGAATKYGVAHPRCVGVTTKSRINGGLRVIGEPESPIETREEKETREASEKTAREQVAVPNGLSEAEARICDALRAMPADRRAEIIRMAEAT